MDVRFTKKAESKGLIFKKKIYKMWIWCQPSPKQLFGYSLEKNNMNQKVITTYQYDGKTIAITPIDLMESFYALSPSAPGKEFEFENERDMVRVEKEIVEASQVIGDYLDMIAGDNDPDADFDG